MRTMAVVLLGLVCLAGCTGPTGPGGEQDPTEPAGVATFPPGYAEDGVNVTLAEPRHERLAVASGSLTLTVRTEIGSPAGRDGVLEAWINATESYRVDFRNESVHWTVTGVTDGEGYLPPGGQYLYVRTPRENPNVSEYGMRSARNLTRYANPRLDHVDMFAFVSALNMTFVRTHDGRLEYRATRFGPTEWGTRLAGVRPSEFRNVSARLTVDETGRVHMFAFEGDVHRPDEQYQMTYSLTVRVRGYGTTTPEPPDWVDEARETFGD